MVSIADDNIISMPAWEQLQPAGLSGLVMIVGEPDTGKSTLARYLLSRLVEAGKKAVLVDGDPGQTSLGPPGTMTAMIQDGRKSNTVRSNNVKSDAGSERRMWRWFVGSTAPTGHMLPVLVGAARLAQAAASAGAEAILYDTCGLVSPAGGGLALKTAKINLLQPSTVIAIQRQRELEPLLQPLRLNQRLMLVELQPSPEVRPRSSTARQQHRARQFAEYFHHAGLMDLNWSNLAVLPAARFRDNQLVGLEAADGFLLGLGILRRFDAASRQITLLTPVKGTEKIAALSLGDLLVDFDTFQDTRIDAH